MKLKEENKILAFFSHILIWNDLNYTKIKKKELKPMKFKKRNKT